MSITKRMISYEMENLFLAVLTFNTLSICVSGYTLTEETSLHNTLTTGYLSSLRPGSDRSQPVQVNVSFCLRSIKEFEETSGKFSIIGDFELTWIDERIAWTPSSNGYINTTTFPQKQVWVPDLICRNPFGQIQGLSIDQVIVQYDYMGQASWMPGNLFESSCDADVTYYPYDSQTCTLQFMAWGYKSTDVYLNPTSDTSALTFYTENGLWVLKSTRMYTEIKGTDMQVLNLEYKMKRRSSFYLINLLMPMCLMAMLHIIVFILPADSGERVGYSVTILLALAVYMSIVAEALPEASEPQLSVLSYKLLVDIILGSVMMALTVIGLIFHHEEESEPVPEYWARFAHFFTRWPCKKSKTKVSVIAKSNIDLKKETDPEASDIKTSENNELKWSLVAKAFDNFCLLFAIMLNMILNIGFLTTIFTAP